MSRSFYQFNVNDTNQALNNITYILTHHGFKNKIENNENVWRWGTGFLTAPKYIRIDVPQDHVIVISAWIRPFLIGEVQIDDSFVGIIPKEEMKSVIRVLQQNIR